MSQRQQWIEPSHPIFSVREQAALLELNRSNIYYRPRLKTLSGEQLGLLRLVDEIYTRYPFFGTRQMSAYLSAYHYPCGRYPVRWAYQHLGLHSVAPGPHTSQGHPEHKTYPYLLQEIVINKPCQVFSTDITYIRMHKGFVYLMAILDWYSRFVLDWELSISLEADFCIQTLARVLESTRCEIFNTDQGAQFTSDGFTNVLKAHQIQISMDGKGRWLDNVFIERLWRSVKYECVYLNEWTSILQVRNGLREYFNFYNYVRPHQSLNGLTPYQIHSGQEQGDNLF